MLRVCELFRNRLFLRNQPCIATQELEEKKTLHGANAKICPHVRHTFPHLFLYPISSMFHVPTNCLLLKQSGDITDDALSVNRTHLLLPLFALSVIQRP